MKLIDAEILEDALDWIIDPCVRHDTVDTIREQEEVDAIPVKFIIEYINKGGEDKISKCLQEWEDADS